MQLIALPSIIVGRNFSLVWDSMKPHKNLKPKNQKGSQGAYQSLGSPEDDDDVGNGGDKNRKCRPCCSFLIQVRALN